MSLFSELKRRNVFKVGIAYIIVGWLIMQAGDTLAAALHLPDWVNSLLVFFLLLGFPAEIYAWRNEPDVAFKWLNQAFDQHDPGMGSLLKDSSLKSLHGDPGWELLLEKIGLLNAWKAMPASNQGTAQ